MPGGYQVFKSVPCAIPVSVLTWNAKPALAHLASPVLVECPILVEIDIISHQRDPIPLGAQSTSREAADRAKYREVAGVVGTAAILITRGVIMSRVCHSPSNGLA
jgi:hypothetical protein